VVPREEMVELVNAHSALEDPMETAIWIRREDREAWLVELIPSLGTDKHPERPVAFNPGLSFRHPLNLTAGNLDALRSAMEGNPQLARDVAAGEVLYGDARGRELQEIARAANGHAQAG
jgi:hypothetical protein